MKRPTAEAAASLSGSLHPVNFLLISAEVGYTFDDVWPSIEETWIEAVRARHWEKYPPPGTGSAVGGPIDAQADGGPAELGVSDEAGLLVEKLKRKSMWGGNRLSPETMQKLTHLDPVKLQSAIHELVRKGLLEQGRPGSYSLDPGRQYEIDRIAELMTERPIRR